MQNVKTKDEEEELLDSSTTAALVPESNVEHIKQVEEKMDTGVLDGVADESDRILGKKNKGKKKMFRKNGNGKAIVNPWVNGSGSGSGSSSDTAMDLEAAKARIAELEEKLQACQDGGEYGLGEGGDELEELGFIPEDGSVGIASTGSVFRYGYCNIDNSFRDCYGGKKWFIMICNPNVSLTIFITMLFHM